MLNFRRKFTISGSPVKPLPSDTVFVQPQPQPQPLLQVEQNKRPLVEQEEVPFCSEQVLVDHESPAKRCKLSDEEELRAQSNTIDNDINQKMSSLETIMSKILALKTKRFAIEDQFEVARLTQLEVRNLLNDIFNPGNAQAERASLLIEESHRVHHTKLDKLIFEQSNHMDKTAAAITRKIEQLSHEIELHKRTLMTISCQKAIQEETVVDTDAQVDVTKDDVVETEKEKENEKEEESCCVTEKEDDCVIVDEKKESNCQNTENQVSDGAKDSNSEHEGNQSETTILFEADDDEKTDIEDVDQDEDENETSFTPCQAQRPKM